MESSNFYTHAQTLNEDFSEQKSQSMATSNDELLSDEELAAVSGGGNPFSDFGEGIGRWIGRTFWNKDRC